MWSYVSCHMSVHFALWRVAYCVLPRRSPTWIQMISPPPRQIDCTVSANHLSSRFQARPTIHMLPFQDLPTDLTLSSRKGISKPKCETLRDKLWSFNMNDGFCWILCTVGVDELHSSIDVFDTFFHLRNRKTTLKLCSYTGWGRNPGGQDLATQGRDWQMGRRRWTFFKAFKLLRKNETSNMAVRVTTSLEVVHCNTLLWLKFFGVCSSIFMAHHYQILCLQQTASHEEIRLAFKRRALQETGSVWSISFVGVYSKYTSSTAQGGGGSFKNRKL